MGRVQLDGVKKSFGSVEVIHELSLDIAEGEFVALVGPSGCGKSTLLRMIAGLEEVSAGKISIAEKDVTDLPPRARNIAMVFQSYALYPHMTVAENMGFNLKLSGMSKKEMQPHIERVANMLGLSDLLDRRPGQLSGGQRQRVAMGRAVVRDPSVFLFDEPLSNLDAKLRVQMRAEIKTLHQRVKRTSIYVTHDQIEAMTLADRIVVLHGGKIEQQGSPMDLYLKPANIFVAGFIGSPSMNFINATIEIGDDGPVARLADNTTLHVPNAAGLETGHEVIVGLRPENLVPAKGKKNTLKGHVKLVEPTGAQTHVIFDTAGVEATAVIESAGLGTIGDEMSLQIDPALIHVFDAKTGQCVSN